MNNPPTREEFEHLEAGQRELREEVRKLCEQVTEPIKITRLEIDQGNLQELLMQANNKLERIILKIGWIQPACVCLSTQQSTEICIRPETRSDQDYSVLKIRFPQDHIDYFQPEALGFPKILTEQGLVIDGRVPN